MTVVVNVELRAFSGTHYEIGVQQGQAGRILIHEALERLPNDDSLKLLKPRSLPTFLFVALAKRKAHRLLRNDVFEYCPRQAQRLSGIAEGAEIGISTAFFLQGMELLLGTPNYRVEACSTLAFSPDRTKTQQTIVAKNFDYINYLAPYQLVCETIPKDGYATLACTAISFAGMFDGMNEHGLTVTYNLANTVDKPQCHVPLSMVLQEMLETCKNTDEAAQFVTKAKRGGHDALLTLADAEGNIKTVEVTSNHSKISEMEGSHVVNTNHYKSDEMKKHEIPRNAVFFGKGVRKDAVGIRVYESSEQRLKRAEEMLTDRDKLDENDIVAILRDHGKENKPSFLTICRHDEYASTLRSVIFCPNRKSMKVLYGKPCQNQYEEFRFSHTPLGRLS